MTQIYNPPILVELYERALKLAVVRWVKPGWIWQSAFSQVVIAGVIHYEPIFVPERTTYDRIGVFVSVGDGVGGEADLRIFNFEGGVPTSLVLSAGAVSTNAMGAQEIVISQVLDRGYYFLACRCDQTPELRGITASGLSKTSVPGFGLANAISDFNEIVGLVTAIYADPAPAPTSSEVATHAFVRLREA